MIRDWKWKSLSLLSLALCAGCGRFPDTSKMAEFSLADLGRHTSLSDSPSMPLESCPDPVAATSFSAAALSIDDSVFREIQHDDARSVVSGFLDALKRGDSRIAQQLLSARSTNACSTSQLELVVPASHPLAEYRVLQSDFVPGQGEQLTAAAHVRCLWSDSSMPGTQELIFVLRSESPGWRIAGLVVENAWGADVFDLESAGELASLSVSQ